MKKKKPLYPEYPGIEQAEKERIKAHLRFVNEQSEQADYISTAAGISPNYEKFAGWDPEKVLVWLNID